MIGLAPCLPVRAEATRPDLSFHPNISDGRSAGSFLILQPDGRIIADSGHTRYFADGTRDPSYTLAPEFKSLASATAAPDGRLFVVYRDLNGGVGTAILSPNGALLGHPAAIFSSGGIFQPDGKFLTNGSPLVRLNGDGSLDSTFYADAGGAGLALLPDGKLLVGGGPRLVRLTSTGLIDRTFDPTFPGNVTALQLLPNGKILVLDTTRNLTLLNADGSLARVVGTVDGNPYRLALGSDGRPFVIGGFRSVAGLPRRNVARLNLDGTVDPTFDASVSLRGVYYETSLLAVQPDGRLIVNAGGGAGGAPRILRLNTDGSVDATFAIGSPLASGYFTAAPRADGRIYVAGWFSSIDGVPAPGIARLMTDGTVDRSFSPTASLTLTEGPIVDYSPGPPQLQLVALSDGGVVVAGTLMAANGVSRAGIARFSASGALDPNFNPLLDTGGSIQAAAALADGRIVVGGSFSSINGVPRANLAVFQNTGELDPVFGTASGTNGAVRRLVANANGRVFVTGDFTVLAGARRLVVGALASNGTLDASFVPNGLTATEKLTAVVPLPDGGVMIAPYLRRLKPTGETDSNFPVLFSPTSSELTALGVDRQGRILVAYNLTVVTGFGLTPDYSEQPFLQRFTGAGAFDPTFSAGATFPTAPSYRSTAPTTLVVSPDGSVLVGATFDTPSDGPRAVLARFVSVAPTNNGLRNISTRAETAQGASVLTAGFVIGGSFAKTVLIRAAGPSLTAFGVTGAISDPQLTLFHSGEAAITNDNWGNKKSGPLQEGDPGFPAASAGDIVGAFPLAPLDAAIVATLDPGAYTAQVQAGGGETKGVALIEVYDADGAADNSRLLNISSRGTAGDGSRTLIAGFVVAGSVPRTVLVRGVGPGLTAFHTDGALADPVLTLSNANGSTVASNNDWGLSPNAAEIITAATKVGAFALGSGSKDSALLVTLPPGNYTAAVNGANGATGIALVEVYEVP